MKSGPPADLAADDPNDGDQARYRILSLDGGGTWAVIQVLTLIDLFGCAATGHEVLKRFHLAVANSGGAAILASLAVDHRLSDILELYTDETKRRSTFQRTWWPLARASGFLPQYSTRKKRAALSKYLGPGADQRLLDWHGKHPRLANLLITGFDYDVQRAQMFRTNPRSLARALHTTLPRGVTLLDAVDASTNAPVNYYDEPAHVQPPGEPARRYWDGALAGYNNPVMAGVVEALADRDPDRAPASETGRRRPQIQIVSIGNGTVHRPRRPPKIPPNDPRFAGGGPSGVFRDLRTFSDAILDDPPDAATFTAHVTLGGALPEDDDPVVDGPIVRMNPVVRPERHGDQWTWPQVPRGSAGKSGAGVKLDPEDLERLTSLPLDAVSNDEIKLVMDLAYAWLAGYVPNQPIRFNEETLEAEIGHDTYPDAKVALEAFDLHLLERVAGA
jgi:hypothetical protein